MKRTNNLRYFTRRRNTHRKLYDNKLRDDNVSSLKVCWEPSDEVLLGRRRTQTLRAFKLWLNFSRLGWVTADCFCRYYVPVDGECPTVKLDVKEN